MKSTFQLLGLVIVFTALVGCGKFQAVQAPAGVLEDSLSGCAQGDLACEMGITQNQSQSCPVGQVCEEGCFIVYPYLDRSRPNVFCFGQIGFSGVGVDSDVKFSADGVGRQCYEDVATGNFSHSYSFLSEKLSGAIQVRATKVGEPCKSPDANARVLTSAEIQVNNPQLFFEIEEDRSFRNGNQIRVDFSSRFNSAGPVSTLASIVEVSCGSELKYVRFQDLPANLDFTNSCGSDAVYAVRTYDRIYLTGTIALPCQNGASECGGTSGTTTTTVTSTTQPNGQLPIANIELNENEVMANLAPIGSSRGSISGVVSGSFLEYNIYIMDFRLVPSSIKVFAVDGSNRFGSACLSTSITIEDRFFQIPDLPVRDGGVVYQVSAEIYRGTSCSGEPLAVSPSVSKEVDCNSNLEFVNGLCQLSPSTTTTSTTTTTLLAQQGPGSFDITLSQVFAPRVPNGSDSANITGFITAQVENQSGQIVNFSTVVVAEDAQGRRFESGCINSSGPNRNIQNVGFQIPNVKLGTYGILAFSYFGFGCSGEMVGAGDITDINNFEIRCFNGTPDAMGVCGPSTVTTTSTTSTTSTTQPAPIASPVLRVLNPNVLIQNGASTGTANFEVAVFDVNKSYQVMASGPGFTNQPVTACFGDINAFSASPLLPDLVFSANWIQAFQYTFNLVECNSTVAIKTAFVDGQCSPNYEWDPNEARCLLATVVGSLSIGNNAPLARQPAPADHLAVPTGLRAEVRLNSRRGKAILIQVRSENGSFLPVACEFADTVTVPAVNWLTDRMLLRMVAVDSCSATASQSDVVDSATVELVD